MSTHQSMPALCRSEPRGWLFEIHAVCGTAGGVVVRLDLRTGTRIGQWGWPSPQQQSVLSMVENLQTVVF
jgi:hypothetical protein